MQARPFIKAVGGKTQLLPELLKHMPRRWQDYHEPFLGGGALFWELANRGLFRQHDAHLSDTAFEQRHAASARPVLGWLDAHRGVGTPFRQLQQLKTWKGGRASNQGVLNA